MAQVTEGDRETYLAGGTGEDSVERHEAADNDERDTDYHPSVRHCTAIFRRNAVPKRLLQLIYVVKSQAAVKISLSSCREVCIMT